ncbi:MAG: SRPBCC family protein [Thaumarchaeota archaeon]|nr:SRPBCC family protein [Nitrososphaerota archaeon]
MDVIRVSKTINAPLRYVYDWCTDFRDTDPQITGSKSQRRIVEKTRKRTIYVQIYEGADGREKVAVDIVTLKPHTSWHLDYFGEEDDETGEYRLKKLGESKTRLDMVFTEKWKDIAKVPSIEEQMQSTNEVWDKYVAALEKEYKSSK